MPDPLQHHKDSAGESLAQLANESEAMCFRHYRCTCHVPRTFAACNHKTTCPINQEYVRQITACREAMHSGPVSKELRGGID